MQTNILDWLEATSARCPDAPAVGDDQTDCTWAQLADTARREALEETGYAFDPKFIVGVYNWRNEAKDITYLRFAFGGEIVGHDAERKLDEGIIAARWLTLDEIRALKDRHRSPLILQCIEDWQAGKRYPLELVTHYA